MSDNKTKNNNLKPTMELRFLRTHEPEWTSGPGEPVIRGTGIEEYFDLQQKWADKKGNFEWRFIDFTDG